MSADTTYPSIAVPLSGIVREQVPSLDAMQAFYQLRRTLRRHVRGHLVRSMLRQLAIRADSGDLASLHDYAARARLRAHGRVTAAHSVAAEAIEEFPSYGDDPASGQLDPPPGDVRWFRPRAEKRDELIFYVHGGGFIIDASPAVTKMMSKLAVKASASMLRPAYRLAPEHPCPAAVEDVLASYEWIRTRQPDRPVVMVAESCGCNIGLVALQQAAKRGLPMPKGILLFSPWVDMTLTSWSMIAQSVVDRSPFNLDLIALVVQLYLQGRLTTDEWAYPLGGSFEGFPPVLIHTSAADMFHDDAIAVARKIEQANGRLMVRTWMDNDHVWEQFQSRDAEASLTKAARFVRDCFDDRLV